MSDIKVYKANFEMYEGWSIYEEGKDSLDLPDAEWSGGEDDTEKFRIELDEIIEAILTPKQRGIE
jgi:hypothetical protein